MLPVDEKHLRRILWISLGGTKGGPVRLRILHIIGSRPSNTNQLAKTLGMDYTTIMYHLRVLEKSGFVQAEKGYGGPYFLSPLLEQHKAVLDEIAAHIGKGL